MTEIPEGILGTAKTRMGDGLESKSFLGLVYVRVWVTVVHIFLRSPGRYFQMCLYLRGRDFVRSR